MQGGGGGGGGGTDILGVESFFPGGRAFKEFREKV